MLAAGNLNCRRSVDVVEDQLFYYLGVRPTVGLVDLFESQVVEVHKVGVSD